MLIRLVQVNLSVKLFVYRKRLLVPPYKNFKLEFVCIGIGIYLLNIMILCKYHDTIYATS